MGNPLVPGDEDQPVGEPPGDEAVRSEPLGDAGVVLENAPAGERSLGGGEFPDRDTPASGSAPGPEDAGAPGMGVIDESDPDPPEPSEPG
jgi:hypothetical protein